MTDASTTSDTAPGAREIDLEALSLDARALAAVWFGMRTRTTINLHLRESRPTARTQAAIDELVAKGIASVETYNEFGGLVYRPLVDCANAFIWFSKRQYGPDADPEKIAEITWQLYEPITEDQSYALMTPFGQGVMAKERRGLAIRDNPYDAATQGENHAQWRQGHRAGQKPDHARSTSAR